MTLIRKPSELSVQTKIKALLYGQAGTGKSTLALSAPKPLMLDFDGGVHRVNFLHQSPTVQITSWEDCENVLKEDLSDYDSLIIDTGGKMLDYMAEYIIRKNSKMGRSNGALTLQGFGERKGMFRQFCRTTMLMNKHLIFVAHRDTQKINEDYRYVPMFGGSSYDDLVTDLDLVGYLEAVGKKRIITFDPSDRNDGKNTCNLPSAIELPGVIDASGNGIKNTFLTEHVINPYIANLEKRKGDAVKYNEVIEGLRTAVNLITDEKSANEFMKTIDEWSHVGSSKAAAGILLSKKTKELGLKLNKQKVYEKVS
jgi:hypothetical protein